MTIIGWVWILLKLAGACVVTTIGLASATFFTVAGIPRLLEAAPKWIRDFFRGAFDLGFLGRAVAEPVYQDCYRAHKAGQLSEERFRRVQRWYDRWSAMQTRYVHVMKRFHSAIYPKNLPTGR